MKKIMFYVMLFAAFSLSGCVIRTSSQEMDRVDQELKGNRGIVTGKKMLPDAYPKDRRKTRTVYNVEIELASPLDIEREKAGSKGSDSRIEGNRGYVGRKTLNEDKDTIPGNKGNVVTLKPLGSPASSRLSYQVPETAVKKEKIEKGAEDAAKDNKAPATYIVEKGDTLQKISEKIYGTTKKWKKIYEANKDSLESPDSIFPGQKLALPEK